MSYGPPAGKVVVSTARAASGGYEIGAFSRIESSELLDLESSYLYFDTRKKKRFLQKRPQGWARMQHYGAVDGSTSRILALPIK